MNLFPYHDPPDTFGISWVNPGVTLTSNEPRLSSKVPSTCKHRPVGTGENTFYQLVILTNEWKFTVTLKV